MVPCSGAGTNLKVPSAGIFLSCPSAFFRSTSTIDRFGERFRDGQYSLVSFSFAVLLLTVPPRAQQFVKVGSRAHVPYGVGATDPRKAVTHVQSF